MCFSATASYSTAVILTGAGAYASAQARRFSLPRHWHLWGLVPIFFGLQQAFEGGVWQSLESGQSGTTLPLALGFHFFSHFLWLWWLPLSSYLVEPNKLRKRIFSSCALLGMFFGTLVFTVMLLHPEWMVVGIKEHSIIYKFHVPYRSSIHLPFSPAAIYALIILTPLLLSSHNEIRIFGCLAALASLLTSTAYEHAYISVWCFFAAVLSLYLVYMIHTVSRRTLPA